MSLRRRVVAAAAAVTVVAVLLGVWVGMAVHRAQSAVGVQTDRWGPAAARSQSLLAHVVDQETGERGFVITGDPSYLQPYEAGATLTAGDIQALSGYAAGAPAVTAALNRVVADIDRWQARSARPEIAARQRSLQAALTRVRRGDGKRLFDSMRTDIGDLQAVIDRERLAASDRVHSANSTVIAALWVTAVVAAVSGAAVLIALRNWVLRPLHSLSGVLRRVASGDLQTTVEVAGAPDFSSVAEDADAMRRRILDELERSEQAREALEQRGPVVLGLSEQLRHRTGEPIPGLRYAAALRPAEGILAGDWVDVLPLGGNRVALLLIDVSGHGAAAGLEALRLKHILTTALRLGHDPHEAFARAADGFTDDERFATGVIVVLDVATGRLRWANAGHLSPRLVPLDADVLDADDLPALEPTGPLLSAQTDGWTTRAGALEAGHLLLAFSDGLTEARDAGGREFGLAGITTALSETTVRDVDTVVSACVAAVRTFSAQAHRDDITVVAATLDSGTLLPPQQRAGDRRRFGERSSASA